MERIQYAHPEPWWPSWPLTGRSANEAKGARVLPSRPRPVSRSVGRIHMSDYSDRAGPVVKRSRVHTNEPIESQLIRRV